MVPVNTFLIRSLVEFGKTADLLIVLFMETVLNDLCEEIENVLDDIWTLLTNVIRLLTEGEVIVGEGADNYLTISTFNRSFQNSFITIS